MKSTVAWFPLLVLTLCTVLASAQDAIPAGTILPVRLNTSLNTKNLRVGRQFTARLMQDVPLPEGKKIPEGAKIVGHVVQVGTPGANQPGMLAIRFDEVQFAHRTVPVITGLRALASLLEVRDAETPKTGPDRGTPARWASRILVGGEAYHGDGGPVTRGSDTVGEGLIDGVLAPVSASANSRCEHAPQTSAPQALWVFSSDVCGPYGFENITITHAGYQDPRGDIQLTAAKGNVEVGSGSGMLLQVSAAKD